MKPVALFNFLNHSQALVIDVRPPHSSGKHNVSTIIGAMHGVESTLVHQLRKQFPFRQWTTTSAVLIGATSPHCIDELGVQAVVYIDSLTEFLTKYPFLRAPTPTSSENSVSQLRERTNYPSEVIPDRLFLGCKEHALPRIVGHLGISRICRMLNEEPSDEDKNDPSILHIQIDDRDTEELPLEDAVEWVGEQIRGGQRVLIHCNMGVSRSAALCIAFVMKDSQVSLDRAYKFVEKQRPYIRPNPGFMRQLKQWEGTLARRREAGGGTLANGKREANFV